MRSTKSDLKFATSIVLGDYTDSTEGEAVSVIGFATATAVVVTGVVTDGDWLPVLEASADGETWEAAAEDEIEGAFVSLVSGLVQLVGYYGDRRYLRVVVGESEDDTPGADFFAGILLGAPQYAPVG